MNPILILSNIVVIISSIIFIPGLCSFGGKLGTNQLYIWFTSLWGFFMLSAVVGYLWQKNWKLLAILITPVYICLPIIDPVLLALWIPYSISGFLLGKFIAKEGII